MKRLWRLLTACALSSTLALTGCSGGGSAVTTPSGVLNSQPQSIPQTKMTVTVTRTTKANTPSSARRIQDIPAGTNAIEIDAYPGTQSVPASGTLFTPPSGIIPITTCANFPQSQSSITLSAQIPIGPATVVISTYSGVCSNNVATGSILSQAVGTGTATAAGGDLGATFFGTTAGGAIILAAPTSTATPVPTPKPYSIVPFSNISGIAKMNSKGDVINGSGFASAPNYSFTSFPSGLTPVSLSNNDEVVAVTATNTYACNSSGTTCQPVRSQVSPRSIFTCLRCNLNSNGIVVGPDQGTAAAPGSSSEYQTDIWQTNLMDSATPASSFGFLLISSNPTPVGNYFVINDSFEIAFTLYEQDGQDGELTVYSATGRDAQGQFGDETNLIGNLPGGVDAEARAINYSGHIVGSDYISPGSGYKAFFINEFCSSLSQTSPGGCPGVFVDLGVLPGMSSAQATAINDNDQIVGYSCTDAFLDQPCHAFITSPNSTMIDINSLLPLNSGWVLTSAVGIDNAGDIAVQGNHNGQVQFAILHPQ